MPAAISRLVVCTLALVSLPCKAFAQDNLPWPPAKLGNSFALSYDAFLQPPAAVEELAKKDGAAKFTVAKAQPKIVLNFHDQLGENAANRRLWSSWGDIALAKDGTVYCGIGDHGFDEKGDARCFVYRFDPKTSRLTQVVDMNKVVPAKPGRPAWSKIHAKIDEGTDGNIYFSCTLNDGNRAKNPSFGFDDEFTGGQLYRYDPRTSTTTVFASLPARRCTATSILDTQRNLWWCNLEAGEGNALWCLDMKTGKPVYQADDGSLGFNRAFALLNDGSILFNGAEAGGNTPLLKFSLNDKRVHKTNSAFADCPGIRCASRESKDGKLYGITYKTNQLYCYDVKHDKLEMLGNCWLLGSYVTVCELSPDERYLYYLPGAHGKAYLDGTPVIQYDIAKKQQKVIAFLAPALEKEIGYVPAGTYGVKISADGSVVYVNFNGHPAEALRPKHIKPNGFGLTAFAAIHIPESER